MKILMAFSALVFTFSSRSSAGELEGLLARAEVKLLHVQGKQQGLVLAMRWDDKECSVGMGRQDSPISWKKAMPEPCSNVRAFIIANFKTLKKEALKGTALSLPPYGPFGAVHLGEKLKFQADLNASETCDYQMKNCVKPKLSLSSQLAVLLRSEIGG